MMKYSLKITRQSYSARHNTILHDRKCDHRRKKYHVINCIEDNELDLEIKLGNDMYKLIDWCATQHGEMYITWHVYTIKGKGMRTWIDDIHYRHPKPSQFYQMKR